MTSREPVAGMQHTVSADGTHIAYRQSGSGPVLLIVGGALSDHTSYVPLAEELSAYCTTIIWDRRGRGQSQQGTSPYSPEREIEDVDALLATCGGKVAVYGHSSGAALALRAAAAGLPISRLILGDPPYSPNDVSADAARAEHAQQADTLRALIASHNHAGAVRYFLAGFGLPDDDLDALLASPTGEAMCQLAVTLPQDYAMLGDGVVPHDVAAGVRIPALVLSAAGEDTVARQLTKALPHGRLQSVPAPLHALEPSDYAAHITNFVNS
jgi:pimeloyl-ACP methyl ester carboxylesterase